MMNVHVCAPLHQCAVYGNIFYGRGLLKTNQELIRVIRKKPIPYRLNKVWIITAGYVECVYSVQNFASICTKPSAGACESYKAVMNFDRKRRGKGRDKRDSFGDDSYDGYQASSPFQNDFGGGRPSGGPGGGGGFRGPPRERAPAMPAQVIGAGKGIVKFFNGQKGFGFIQCDDRPDDVFVHISAVEQAGLTGLAEGQPLEFTLVDRAGKVSASDLVIDGDPLPVTDAAPRPERNERSGGFQRGGDRDGGARPQAGGAGEHANGTVKFFNDMKGFGFIQRDDGGEDVFVHISALERSGLGVVAQGDRLGFDIEIDRRGKYSATNLSALSE
jgi:cold shock protein